MHWKISARCEVLEAELHSCTRCSENLYIIFVNILCTSLSLRGSYLCELISLRGLRIVATILQAGKQTGEAFPSHEQYIILL